MSADAVTVRMYRGILGDCFLLMIGPDEPAKRSHILIDCGVLQGVRGGKARMREIVQNIRDTTAGRLDCIIVTHEHFDHMSGFDYAADLFEEFEIGRLWLAWTEDPDDPLGSALQERFSTAHRMLAALSLAADATVGGEVPADDEEHILGLGGFRGLPADFAALAVGAEERGSRRTFSRLRSWANGIDYLSPGDVLDTPSSNEKPALRAYILGPPRDEKLLFKALPSRGEAKETYLALNEETDPREIEAGSPFAPRYRWFNPLADPKAPVPDFVQRRYFAESSPCRYDFHPPDDHDCAIDWDCRRRQDYRRIDDIPAIDRNALALKMDNKTNNTSLVIAFELADTSTLLFAADAQVGNWLSWEQVKFSDKATGTPVETSTESLLGRARLYKVGHHGSHNATLRAKGLELMTGKHLAVMIPTVEETALAQGSKGWLMPNPETYKGIIRQCRGRIMRGDMTVAEARAQAALMVAADPDLEDIQLDEDFAAHTDEDNYVEYRISV